MDKMNKQNISDESEFSLWERKAKLMLLLGEIDREVARRESAMEEFDSHKHLYRSIRELEERLGKLEKRQPVSGWVSF
jgi:hypothetical protein